MKKHFNSYFFVKAFLPALIFFGLITGIAAQNSCQPLSPRIKFTNSTDFNFATGLFKFNYQGTDGNLLFTYNPSGSAAFSSIYCTVNNTYTFNPSLGGVAIGVGGKDIYPWTAGVHFSLQETKAAGDTLFVKWKMMYDTAYLFLNYSMYIAARTLVVDISAEQANASILTFDRTYNTKNPKIVPIPYYTNGNILYTSDNSGNNVFVSLFLDWEKTTASEIYPQDIVYSDNSVFYAQYARYLPNTTGQRPLLKERFYLSVSPSLPDVLPHIPNPVSRYKSVSSSKLVMDNWEWRGFGAVLNDLTMCHLAGINKLWPIIHVWQKGGFDNMYPDVLPANASFGGNDALQRLSDSCRQYGYLFSLHENYCDFYPNSSFYNTGEVSLNTDGLVKKAWYNTSTSIQSYQMKPSATSKYIDLFAPQIHSLFATKAAFLDVHSAANPTYMVDYDAFAPGNASYQQTIFFNRQAASSLRNYHEGPVSGEGNHHFVYAGYFDDFEAQINTGKQNSGFWQGSRLPLLVDFNLRKIHPLMCMHGVGYYERFFSYADGSSYFHKFPIDSALIYIATELAYGNGGFIPFRERTTDFLQLARIEYNQVLPAQMAYANANVLSITYDDNGTEMSVSDYIARHPYTFDDIGNTGFMGKVKVVYDNGTIVYVNRHPTLQWQLSVPGMNYSYNFHALINGIDSLGIGENPVASGAWLLPPNSGWLVISPSGGNIPETDSLQFLVFPNPVKDKMHLIVPNAEGHKMQLVFYNLCGQKVYSGWITNVNESITVPHGLFGVYIANLIIGEKQYQQKIIISK